MTDTELPHPNFYLKRAQTQARTVRSWIHRNNPPPLDPTPDSVVWVMGVFDELDSALAGAVKSAEALAPTAGTESRRRREETRHSLNLHQLERADETTTAILQWASSMRWSEGVKPADLDQLDLLARKIKENLRHLLAEAQEQDLAR